MKGGKTNPTRLMQSHLLDPDKQKKGKKGISQSLISCKLARFDLKYVNIHDIHPIIRDFLLQSRAEGLFARLHNHSKCLLMKFLLR